MPGDEKELENLDAEEFADMDSLADFVEIDDLESLEGMEEFADVADDSDTSSADALPEENAADAAVKETAPEEDDVPLPDTVEDDVLLPDMDSTEDEIPLPDVDALDETALPETASEEEVSLPDVDALSDIDAVADEMPLPDVGAAKDELPLPDMESIEDEIPLPDMDNTDDEVPLPDMDAAKQELPPSEISEMTEKMADADGDAPRLFAEDEEMEAALPEEDALTEPALDEDTGSEAGSASDAPEEEPLVLDALTDEDVDMALDETEEPDETDSMEDVLDVGLMPDVDSLDESGDSEASDVDDEGLGTMLDGLLDDLDMTGSLSEDGEPEAEEPEAAPDVDTADVLNMLGHDEEENTEVSEDLFDVDIPDLEEETEPEEKEPGLLKRLFGNIVTDEIAEAERKAMEEEEAKAAEKAELDEQKKEEKEQAKAEAAAEKEAKKAAKAEAKAAKKAEKQAKKEEKRLQREEEEAAELEITGKLNKVGVAIIAVFTVVFLTVEIAGTNLYGYLSTKKKANDYFEMGKYEQAYQEVMGTKIKDKDPETYNKIRTVMQVQRSIDSYNNYNEMNYYPDALNALIRGIQRYDSNLEQAKELEVVSQMDGCKEQIVSLLQSEFGVSETEARSLLALDKEQYTKQVVDIALKQKR